MRIRNDLPKVMQRQRQHRHQLYLRMCPQRYASHEPSGMAWRGKGSQQGQVGMEAQPSLLLHPMQVGSQ